jgi:hypothetical protein
MEVFPLKFRHWIRLKLLTGFKTFRITALSAIFYGRILQIRVKMGMDPPHEGRAIAGEKM